MRKKNSQICLVILVTAILTTIGYAELKDFLSVNGNVTLRKGNICKKLICDFDYTGDVQVFMAPKTGYYELEVWGAGTARGYGGYSRGEVFLEKAEKLFVYVGGKGEWHSDEDDGELPFKGGYNGGGECLKASGTGAGATHIAYGQTPRGELKYYENNKEEVLIVAGGAGGIDSPGDGRLGIPGSGGGFKGGNGYLLDLDLKPGETNLSYGGSQELDKSYEFDDERMYGSFGQGGRSKENLAAIDTGGAGGGGWYGGTGAIAPHLPGAGGSGYIGNKKLTNKVMFCYECEQSPDPQTLTVSTQEHSQTATSNYAKEENGFAKIKYTEDRNDKLYDTLATMPNKTDENLDYTEGAKETENGLYKIYSTKDNTYPIYFYRGNVTENNVIFGDYCWQIVRTTENGGTKMIFNGTANNGMCAATENKDIGFSAFNSEITEPFYMIGNNDSTVKRFIDNWYENNLKTLSNYIEDTIYCNDTRKESDSGIYYISHKRRDDGQLSLQCEKQDSYTVNNENGNKKLKYPIALINLDEAIYSGIHYRGTTNSYLAVQSNYWTMSPYYRNLEENTAGVYWINSLSGDRDMIVYERKVRPVISLKNEVSVISGSGSPNNPYIIK